MRMGWARQEHVKERRGKKVCSVELHIQVCSNVPKPHGKEGL